MSFGFGGRFVVMFPRSASTFAVRDATVGQMPTSTSGKLQNGALQVHKLTNLLKFTEFFDALNQFPGPLSPEQPNVKQQLTTFLTQQVTLMQQNISIRTNLEQQKQKQQSEHVSQDNKSVADIKRQLLRDMYRMQLLQLLQIIINTNQPNQEQALDTSISQIKNLLHVSQQQSQQLRTALRSSIDLDFDDDVIEDEDNTFVNDSGNALMSSVAAAAAATVGSSGLEISAKHIAYIEAKMMEGEIDQARAYALENKLWAHAMLLSSMIGKKAYQDAAMHFAMNSFRNGTPIKTLYMMFAERDDALFHQAPQPQQQQQQHQLQQQGSFFMSHSQQQQGQQQRMKICKNWQSNVSIVLANITNSTGAVLNRIGNSLWKDLELVEAAHFCYVVSQYCCDHHDSNSKIVLLGSDHKVNKRHFISISSIQRQEIYEFCLQEKKQYAKQLHINPQFMAYQLIYAHWLAEVGLMQKSAQYTATILKHVEHTRTKIAYNPLFIYHLQTLKHRLFDAEKLNKSSLSTSSSDQVKRAAMKSGKGVTGWLLGKLDTGLNKFIHGDDTGSDGNAQQQQQQKQQQQEFHQNQPPQQSQSHSSRDIGEVSGMSSVDLNTPNTPNVQSKSQSHENAGLEKKQSWIGSWFSRKSTTASSNDDKKSKKEASLGSSNMLVWNEEVQRWIPRDANPDDYKVQATPPPPQGMMASSISGDISAFHGMSAATSTGNLTSRYVDVGFGPSSSISPAPSSSAIQGVAPPPMSYSSVMPIMPQVSMGISTASSSPSNGYAGVTPSSGAGGFFVPTMTSNANDDEGAGGGYDIPTFTTPPQQQQQQTYSQEDHSLQQSHATMDPRPRPDM